ncbi:MAG: TonB-dependent receptor domain-containing protein [Acidobacteriota bacterium]
MRSLVLLLFWATAAAAQPLPLVTLSGQVSDPSGAVIGSARLQFNNVRTDAVYTTSTGEDGRYVLSLPPGIYSVMIAASGFRPFVRDKVEVRLDIPATFDAVLVVQVPDQQVTVTAKAPLLEAEPETKTAHFQEVLEIREVRESGARDVAEALSKLDGVWKIRKGAIANDIVLRGFQQDNLNVTIDGARIYGACPNNMDPPSFHVDFSEIEHVKVTKGVFDVQHQGSLGGVIDIVNKAPAPGFRATPAVSAGSFGFLNLSGTASYSTSRLQALVGHSFRMSDPYRDARGKSFVDWANYVSAAKDQRAFEVGATWLNFGYATLENQKLELRYSRQRGDLVLYPYLLMDAIYDDADRLNAVYRIENISPVFERVRVQGYFTTVKHWMTDEFRTTRPGGAGSFSMATFADTRALGGRIDAELRSLLVGLEGYRRNWNAVNAMNSGGMLMHQPIIPDVESWVGGAYAEYRRFLGRRLMLTAGGRVDAAQMKARSKGLNPELYWAYKADRRTVREDFGPSGNVWLSYSLPLRLELFAGVGRSVRFPDPAERFTVLKRKGSDWIGNPNLEPTRNTEVDLGFQYRDRRLMLRPTLYYSRLDDYITIHNQARLSAVPGVTNAAARSFENVEAKIYGGEVAYSFAIIPSLLLTGGGCYARGIKEPRPASGILDRDLAEMPPLRVRTALRYGERRFFGEVENVLAGSQRRIDAELKESPTAAYSVVNLKAGVHTKKLKLAIGVDNLANRFYYEHFSFQRDPFRLMTKVPEPGRNLYFTLVYGVFD